MSGLLDHPWWLLTLAVIGTIAIVTVVLNLFSALGDRPQSASVTDRCEVGSMQFLMGLAGTANLPLEQGGTARLLNNGDEFYPAIFDSLRQAEKSINFMVYIWEPGKVSDELFTILTERARAGVAVRVMVDGLGGHKAPDDKIEALKRAGGRWESFHPPHFGKLTRFHKRNHRRAIVIDGTVGYTGGAAVADKWMRPAPGGEEFWRDSMVEVRGCVATNLQSAFTQLWARGTGEILIGEDYYASEHEDDPGTGEAISRHICVISSPSSEAHPLRQVFWISIHSALEKVYITNPYFVPDDNLWDVLKERARAGVDVRVLVPGEKIDIALIRWASHSYYESLLEAGVRIYEYQPAMIHLKHLVVDGRWSVVGSANMDVRSKELNQEDVLGILDEGFARQVEETFLADLQESREIHLDEWRRRPVWHRIPEQFALLFEEQF